MTKTKLKRQQESGWRSVKILRYLVCQNENAWEIGDPRVSVQMCIQLIIHVAIFSQDCVAYNGINNEIAVSVLYLAILPVLLNYDSSSLSSICSSFLLIPSLPFKISQSQILNVSFSINVFLVLKQFPSLFFWAISTFLPFIKYFISSI